MRRTIAVFTSTNGTPATRPYVNISTDEEEGIVFLAMRDNLGRINVLPMHAMDFATLLRDTTMEWSKMLREKQASRDPEKLDVV